MRNASPRRTRRTTEIAALLSASVAAIALGVLDIHVSAGEVGPGTQQGPGRLPPAPGGVIAGIVVNEREEAVPSAQVQAFSVLTALPETQPPGAVPFTVRASGAASTDSAGRFLISGLAPGEYVVAAYVPSWATSNPKGSSLIYAATFYPSVVDYLGATRVSPSARGDQPIRISLVRVPGVRVAGLVVSSSGNPTGGLRVQVSRRFGGFGNGIEVPVFGTGGTSEGTFEIPRLPPGWYRLTVVAREAGQGDRGGEFASRLIDVELSDIEGLSLRLSPGASISGRVVAEPVAGIPSPVGLRVSAGAEEWGGRNSLSATVALDWSFRMSGMPGIYRFGVGSDRAPFVRATRIQVDGVEVPANAGVELTERAHDVVIVVAPRDEPAAAVSGALSSTALVQQFKSDLGRQREIGRVIVDRRDSSVLPMLEPLLAHENRWIRGNTAFVFAALGDTRGYEVIVAILNDRSDRPTLGERVSERIRNDRNQAVGLLGDLRDARAVPLLAPLLKDPEVDFAVPRALGQIGGASAIAALIEALDHGDPGIVVSAIYALEALKAKEAIPRLVTLQADQRRSNWGAQVTVADAATGALAQIR